MWAIVVNNQIKLKGNASFVSLTYDVCSLTEEKFREKYSCDEITYLMFRETYDLFLDKNTSIMKIHISNKNVIR